MGYQIWIVDVGVEGKMAKRSDDNDCEVQIEFDIND